MKIRIKRKSVFFTLCDYKLYITITNYKFIYNPVWVLLTSFLLRIKIIFMLRIEKLASLLYYLIVIILKINATLLPWINFLIIILLIEILFIIMDYKHVLVLIKIFFPLLFCIDYWFYLTLCIPEFAFSFLIVLFIFSWDFVDGIASCVVAQKIEIVVWIAVFDFWILVSLVLL